MRKLATIRKVDAIKPIEGADAIELAVFGGWQVVVKKSQEIKAGMLVVYCEIDSVFPEKPEYEFLRQDKFRLRTKKFRGALSQGLVFKVEEVLKNGDFKEGDDVSQLLGITLYEPPIPAAISGEVAGAYPSSVPKTDEERVQNLNTAEFYEIDFFVTEKLDGTSCSFILDNNGFHVCGRNWEYLEAPEQTFWKLAKFYEIESNLKKYYDNSGSYLALQGEVVGNGIQSNVYNIKGQDIFIFNIFDITKQRYLSSTEYRKVCEEFGLKTVPVVEEKMSVKGKSHDDFLEYAQGKSA
ncbi:MAG TPA: RNA ligase (ATP), partial [bacterium]|nr:RNA ligase (ATP) [bacterium]